MNNSAGPKPVGVVIPLYNATSHLPSLIAGIEKQSISSEFELILLDSSTNPETELLVSEFGYHAENVRPEDFDHAGTRTRGAQIARDRGCEFVVFLTQDAELQDEQSVEHLLNSFAADPLMGVVTGRQIPRHDAHPLEAMFRELRYGDGTGPWRTSNTYSAYRLEALHDVAYFQGPVLFGEDHSTASRLRAAGYSVSYEASARVLHSHVLSAGGLFRRHFDMAANGWIARGRGHVGAIGPGDGVGVLVSEFREVRRRRSASLTSCWILSLLPRALGYGCGFAARWMPRYVGAHLSTSSGMFTKCVLASGKG